MSNHKAFIAAHKNLIKCISAFEAGKSKELTKNEWLAAEEIRKLCASYLNHFSGAQEIRYIWEIDKRPEKI